MKKVHIRIVLGLVGVLLLAYLIGRIGPARILEAIRSVGVSGLALIACLGGVSHLLKTLAWRMTFVRPLPLRQLFPVRLAGEAIVQVAFAGQLAGETARALLLRPVIGLRASVPTVILDRGLFAFTSAAVAVAGTVTALALLPLPERAVRSAWLTAVVFLLVLLLGRETLRRRWTLLSGAVRRLAQLPVIAGPASRHAVGVAEVEAAIFDFYHLAPGALRGALLLNLASHALAVAEVYLVLTLLGLQVTIVEAFLIEAFVKVVNIGGIFVPGNLGAYEGGTMLVVQIVGLEPASGLALSLVRRLRNLVWTTLGFCCLWWLGGMPSTQPPTDPKPN